MIVKYLGVGGGGGGGGALGGAKILHKIMAPPLPVIKIVKYCGVGGGGVLGALKSSKDNGASSPCHQDSCSVLRRLEEGVGIGGGGRQNPTQDFGAPLSVIKIVKYCGVGEGGHWWR